jgi:hypothetical protein
MKKFKNEKLAKKTITEKENKDEKLGIYFLVSVILSFLITGIISYFFLSGIEVSKQLILSAGFFFLNCMALFLSIISICKK